MYIPPLTTGSKPVLQLNWPIVPSRTQHAAPCAVRPIVPLFIPFAGCKTRCIFCAQHLQSGQRMQNIATILDTCKKQLACNTLTKTQATPPFLPELAFFGGTFTALAPQDRALCCRFVHELRNTRRISGARCSTRPDAISADILCELWHAGFRTIELGVQSFDDDALECAQRQYTHQQIRQACTLIRAHGFALGIQLMPGMPGVSPHVFLNDVTLALAYGADFLRYYPCQVIEGTALAELWRRGAYTPWPLDITIETLAEAWLLAEHAGVSVIRMGLAPESDFDQYILAGPRHPCLGSIVQGEALLTYVQQAVRGQHVRAAHIPHICQGYFWGHKRHLVSRWARLGIVASNKKRSIVTNVTWHEGYGIHLECDMAM